MTTSCILLAPTYALSSSIDELIICNGQSNNHAQPALPPSSVVPAKLNAACRPVYIDEYVPPAGFWRPMGPVTRNQAVNATLGAPTGELGALCMKWSWMNKLVELLIAAGRTPAIAFIVRSGQPVSYWLSGTGQTTLLAELNYLASVPVLASAARKTLIQFNGESDSTTVPLANAYQANQTANVAQIRGVFPGLRCLLAQVSTNFTTLAQRATVRTGQAAFVAADGGLSTLIDLDALATYPVSSPHFTGAALPNIGTRLKVEFP